MGEDPRSWLVGNHSSNMHRVGRQANAAAMGGTPAGPFMFFNQWRGGVGSHVSTVTNHREKGTKRMNEFLHCVSSCFSASDVLFVISCLAEFFVNVSACHGSYTAPNWADAPPSCPLVNVYRCLQFAIEAMAMYRWFTHEKWWFAIVFSMFTRGYTWFSPCLERTIATARPKPSFAPRNILEVFETHRGGPTWLGFPGV